LITGVVGVGKDFGIGNQLIQWGFLEHRDAQNLQKRVEGNLQRQPLLNDRGEDVNRDGNPDLRLHCVLGSPVKRLDPKVLLDPTKEQLDLPAELINKKVLSYGPSDGLEALKEAMVHYFDTIGKSIFPIMGC
jgi:hypothetical protein